MLEILRGLEGFKKNIYPEKQALFEQLGEGQSPHTLFITCSDSRVDPSLITQTEPGEIFVLRNAGNLVPQYGKSNGGEEATIEFAIKVLGVKNIVVCGHSKCGAMVGLKDGVPGDKLPSVQAWLKQASSTKERVKASGKTELSDYISENVLAQVEHLKGYPYVKEAVDAGQLNLYAGVYDFEKGKAFFYQKVYKRFVESSEIQGTNEQSLEGVSL